jgi:xanthine dehydrogenase accessory factor
MDRRETERILQAIRHARATGERVALATVVRVRGSAYRREGARILVRADGTYECLLSGGCLEPAVVEAASRVIAGGDPVIVSYDLEEDSLWGLGIGCSGAVDIRIERLEDDAITDAWLAMLEGGTAGTLVTPLAGATGRLLVTPQGTRGSLGSYALDGLAALAAGARTARPHPHSGAETIAGAELFFEVSLPPPRLVVFGAGHDAVPLAGHARPLGFDVTVVDVREAFLAHARFPGAILVAAHYSRFSEQLTLDARSFVVIMNHHLERDRESLRFALASDAPYIGLLGPRSRFEKLVAALRARDEDPGSHVLARVRNPIGLALGAETPEEIALSILGEITALRRGFDAGFLNGRDTSLHRPSDTRAFARS